MQPVRIYGLLGLLTLLPLTAEAAPTPQEARDAAYLQEAFGSNLCARDDRELRKLNKALTKRPSSPSHAAGQAR